jgi:hypothetical protein
VALGAVAVLPAGCGSSSLDVIGPSTSKCDVSIANSMDNVPAGGASGTLSVTTTRDCTWAASSGTSWVAITSASSGQGSGSLSYRVASNTSPVARRGTVEVNNTAVAIVQEAAACRFTVTPAAADAPAAGTSLTVQIAAMTGCAWTAASESEWIAISAGATGDGEGSVTLVVAANNGGARRGTVRVAGQAITINQAEVAGPAPIPQPAPPALCAPSLNRTAETFAAAGGNGTVTVTAAAHCTWSASSGASWIAVTSGASAAGSGAVTFSVAANTQPTTRQGTLTIAGTTFTVTQTGVACSYAIQPAGQTMPEAGGTGTVGVTAPGACAWTAVANAGWITVTSGASGSGNGTVAFSVPANTGGSRSGSISVAGHTFTVTQAAASCSYALSPSSQNAAAAGGDVSVGVTAGSACAWTAASDVAWISVVSGSPGTGNGTVVLRVAANAGPARTGSATIAGHHFTVSQAAEACTFSIAPDAHNAVAAGGDLPVTITAGPSCAWSATSNAPWIAFTGAAAGTGSGGVTVSIAPNAGPARNGTATIAGKTLTVAQEQGCTFSVAPPSQAIAAAGGPGTVTVTAAAGCAWAASSNVSWIQVTGGGSGTGDGAVTFNVDGNPGPAARTGTLTIAGHSFTVDQSGL